MDDSYADTITRIDYAGGMIRIELAAVFPKVTGSETTPELRSTRRVVMPLDGFIHMFTSSQRLMDQLVQSGAVKRGNGQGVGTEALGTAALGTAD